MKYLGQFIKITKTKNYNQEYVWKNCSYFYGFLIKIKHKYSEVEIISANLFKTAKSALKRAKQVVEEELKSIL